MSKNKGFTLIELLVVIAIIGVLASVVLGSLSSARDKSSDASIKSNLKSASAQAEIFASYNNFSFAGVCAEGAQTIKKIADAGAIAAGLTSGAGTNTTGSLTTATCNENGTNWAIEVPLKIKNGGTTNMFCVDSKGFVGTKATSFGAYAYCQ